MMLAFFTLAKMSAEPLLASPPLNAPSEQSERAIYVSVAQLFQCTSALHENLSRGARGARKLSKAELDKERDSKSQVAWTARKRQLPRRHIKQHRGYNAERACAHRHGGASISSGAGWQIAGSPEQHEGSDPSAAWCTSRFRKHQRSEGFAEGDGAVEQAQDP